MTEEISLYRKNLCSDCLKDVRHLAKTYFFHQNPSCKETQNRCFICGGKGILGGKGRPYYISKEEFEVIKMRIWMERVSGVLK